MLVIMHACKPSSLKVETGEPRDQDPPQLNRKLKTIMAYMRSCLQTKQKALSWQLHSDKSRPGAVKSEGR